MTRPSSVSPGKGRADERVDASALEVRYEPIVELATGEIVGAEALLRRRMPTGVLQIAGRFLPLAEASGLIVEIGRRVLDDACEQAAGWQGVRRGRFVAVNLSVRQLADPRLPDWVEAVLVRHALPPAGLVLDVPERAVAEAAFEHGAALEHLHRLAALGVRIAVDDVGTGPPCPTYLPLVPASILKIDGRFVRGMRGPGDVHFAPAIVALAHELGLTALAEGIEVEEDAAALRALGCDLAQGYAIGRAAEPAEIAALLAR